VFSMARGFSPSSPARRLSAHGSRMHAARSALILARLQRESMRRSRISDASAPLNLLAGDDGENPLAIENTGRHREVDQLLGTEIFRDAAAMWSALMLYNSCPGPDRGTAQRAKALAPERFDEWARSIR